MSKNSIHMEEEYKYGFHDRDVSVYKTGKGLTRETIEEISRLKGEPQWMKEFRLKAFEQFLRMPLQDWGPALTDLDFDAYTYYIKPRG